MDEVKFELIRIITRAIGVMLFVGAFLAKGTTTVFMGLTAPGWFFLLSIGFLSASSVIEKIAKLNDKNSKK